MNMVPESNKYPISNEDIITISLRSLYVCVHFIQYCLTFLVGLAIWLAGNIAIACIPHCSFFANIVVGPEWCNYFALLSPVEVCRISIRKRIFKWDLK